MTNTTKATIITTITKKVTTTTAAHRAYFARTLVVLVLPRANETFIATVKSHIQSLQIGVIYVY